MLARLTQACFLSATSARAQNPGSWMTNASLGRRTGTKDTVFRSGMRPHSRGCRDVCKQVIATSEV